MTRPAPIIAAVLLLLPVLYVGSYLALAIPTSYTVDGERVVCYQLAAKWCARLYWPLKQIDPRVS
jgi:hypothetical protein